MDLARRGRGHAGPPLSNYSLQQAACMVGVFAAVAYVRAASSTMQRAAYEFSLAVGDHCLDQLKLGNRLAGTACAPAYLTASDSRRSAIPTHSAEMCSRALCPARVSTSGSRCPLSPRQQGVGGHAAAFVEHHVVGSRRPPGPSSLVGLADDQPGVPASRPGSTKWNLRGARAVRAITENSNGDAM